LSRAFTLVEVMIAIAIMAIIMAVGIPGFVNAMKKDSLRKAVSDIVEGCSYARSQAILRGSPIDFVVRADGGHLGVEQVIDASAGALSPEPVDESRPRTIGTPLSFSRALGEDVIVELLYVNFQDKMEQPEARVRFFPNGTSDEFAMIVSTEKGKQKISVDVVTALADVDVIR
jgi:prepilin-type N-terminal cleavage/methylation domain-containing protein